MAELTKVDISTLQENPDNPRTITDAKFEQLTESVRNFPQMLEVRPIAFKTASDGTRIVLGGNMRLRACIAAGLKEVPAIDLSGLTEAQQREFVIKDNVGFGEWDWQAVQADWPEAEAWGLDIPDKFRVLPEAAEDDYEIPDEIETDIVLGDLFEIGPHRLMCGDSTEVDTWDKVFSGQMADLVVTDPPYNVAIQGGNHGDPDRKNGKKIENDSMSDEEFYQFLYDFYTALGSYTKAGGVWYVWYASRETVNFHKAMIDSGLTPKQDLVWLKSSIVMGRQDYQWKHEPCIYGWKEGAAHGWYSDRKQTTILEFDRPSRNKEHPTMKPIPLIAYQIGNSSKQGDIVADGFLGSGTTMVAAHQLNRKCYGMELDPKYCQVIIDRMRKLDPSLTIIKNGVPLPHGSKEEVVL
jgi:DNA modification methylase